MMRLAGAGASTPQTRTAPSVTPLVSHRSPKCQGCPYGDRQYCVGVCWKSIYDSVLNKKRKNNGEDDR